VSASRYGWALAAAAGTGIQVGAAMVATRFVIAETTPAALAFMRYAVALLCLLPFVFRAPRIAVARHDLAPIFVLGVFQFGISIALLNYGLKHLTSARAALIFMTFPLLTMLIGAALGRERLTLAKTIGVLLAFAGVALTLGEKLLIETGADAEWLGALAVFGAAACGASCTVFYRPYLERYPTLPVSALAMLSALVVLAALAAGEGFLSSAPRISPEGWVAIVFIGISSGIFFYLWLWALNHAPPTRVAVFLALSPVTAALLGAAFLGEALTPLAVTGLVLVVLGLWSATRPGATPP
jgi:drug/metabolite transporter (DMT)-like permease